VAQDRAGFQTADLDDPRERVRQGEEQQGRAAATAKISGSAAIALRTSASRLP
jgi:hypothetical protein